MWTFCYEPERDGNRVTVLNRVQTDLDRAEQSKQRKENKKNHNITIQCFIS